MMNWDALGAVGEVAGAIGVIISLVYLATQIRYSARTAEDSATRDVFAGVGVQLTSMVENSNSEVILRGLLDYKNLVGQEKFTFDGLMGSLMFLVESSFISHDAKLLTDDTMENWGCFLRPRLLAYPGMRDWWADTKDIYVPQAQEWIDREIARTDVESDFWVIK